MKDFVSILMIVALIVLIIGLVTPGYASYPYLFTSLGLTVIGWILSRKFKTP